MDGSPDWQVMRHQSPRTPAAQHVENPIDDFASRVFDIDRLFRYRRDQRLQDFPLRVCQIRGIRFPVCHLFFSILVLFTSSSPSLYRLDHAKQTLSKEEKGSSRMKPSRSRPMNHSCTGTESSVVLSCIEAESSFAPLGRDVRLVRIYHFRANQMMIASGIT